MMTPAPVHLCGLGLTNAGGGCPTARFTLPLDGPILCARPAEAEDEARLP